MWNILFYSISETHDIYFKEGYGYQLKYAFDFGGGGGEGVATYII
jgi:hypothetical protein